MDTIWSEAAVTTEAPHPRILKNQAAAVHTEVVGPAGFEPATSAVPILDQCEGGVLTRLDDEPAP